MAVMMKKWFRSSILILSASIFCSQFASQKATKAKQKNAQPATNGATAAHVQPTGSRTNSAPLTRGGDTKTKNELATYVDPVSQKMQFLRSQMSANLHCFSRDPFDSRPTLSLLNNALVVPAVSKTGATNSEKGATSAAVEFSSEDVETVKIRCMALHNAVVVAEKVDTSDDNFILAKKMSHDNVQGAVRRVIEFYAKKGKTWQTFLDVEMNGARFVKSKLTVSLKDLLIRAVQIFLKNSPSTSIDTKLRELVQLSFKHAHEKEMNREQQKVAVVSDLIRAGLDDELSKYLLHETVDHTIPDEFGYTSIFYASLHENQKVVPVLITKKALINGKNKINGIIPLMVAPTIEMERFLLTVGANIDDISFDGDTPLISAAKNCNVDAAKKAFTLNPNVDVQGIQGRTALHWVFEKLETLNLSDSAQSFTYNYSENIKNYWVILKLLMGANASSTIRDDAGISPFMVAIERTHLSPILLYFEHDKISNDDLNTPDNKGRVALTIASQSITENCTHGMHTICDHKAIMELLLEHKAHVNGIANQKPPIFIAIDRADEKLLRVLFRCNVDFDQKYQGKTPLAYAQEKLTQTSDNKIRPIVEIFEQVEKEVAAIKALEDAETQRIKQQELKLKEEELKRQQKQQEDEAAAQQAAQKKKEKSAKLKAAQKLAKQRKIEEDEARAKENIVQSENDAQAEADRLKAEQTENDRLINERIAREKEEKEKREREKLLAKKERAARLELEAQKAQEEKERKRQLKAEELARAAQAKRDREIDQQLESLTASVIQETYNEIGIDNLSDNFEIEKQKKSKKQAIEAWKKLIADKKNSAALHAKADAFKIKNDKKKTIAKLVEHSELQKERRRLPKVAHAFNLKNIKQDALQAWKNAFRASKHAEQAQAKAIADELNLWTRDKAKIILGVHMKLPVPIQYVNPLIEVDMSNAFMNGDYLGWLDRHLNQQITDCVFNYLWKKENDKTSKARPTISCELCKSYIDKEQLVQSLAQLHSTDFETSREFQKVGLRVKLEALRRKREVIESLSKKPSRLNASAQRFEPSLRTHTEIDNKNNN